MKSVGNDTYLSISEITTRFGWSSGTIYNLVNVGFLSKPVKFAGDKKSYWKLSELEALESNPNTRDNPSKKVRAMRGVETDIAQMPEPYGLAVLV